VTLTVSFVEESNDWIKKIAFLVFVLTKDISYYLTVKIRYLIVFIKKWQDDPFHNDVLICSAFHPRQSTVKRINSKP